MLSSSLLQWRLPKMKDQMKIYRKASWLDLFFDLIYVLLFRDLFYELSWDISRGIFAKIALYFIPARIIRHGYNFYVQRFEETSLRHRIMTFLLMLWVWVYSFSIHNYGLEVSLPLVLAGWWVHILLWYLFISAAYNATDTYVPWIAKLVWFFHISYGLAWLCSVHLFPQYFESIMIISDISFLLMLISIPFVFKQVPRLHSWHLSERFWLFIIIVLAELIYWLIAWLSDARIFDANNIFIWVGWFFLWVSIWRLYFDIIGHNPLDKKKMRYVTHWSLLHLPLSLSIIYLWWMFLHIIAQTSSTILQRQILFVMWLLVSAIFFCIWVLSFFHQFAYTEWWRKYSSVKYLVGYVLITQSILLPVLIWQFNILEPVRLVYVLLWLFIVNIILFHAFFDPLDLDEVYE